MNELMNDSLNIDILQLACAGQCIDINVSELSSILGKHRTTIQSRLDDLFQYEIIDSPFLPFRWLLNELPFFVIEKIKLPRDEKTNLWIELDPYILAAFFVKEEEFNTLMIEQHKDLYDYQLWKERMLSEDKVTLKGGSDYISSEPYYLSTKAISKYKPEVSFEILKDNFKRGIHTQIKGLDLDDIYIDLLEALLSGKGIHINANSIAKSLGVNRKTIQRRLEILLKEKIVLPPVCGFPRIWAPPDYLLVISLLEITKNKRRIEKHLNDDPHVTMLFRANVGRYNLLTFSSFHRMDDYLVYEEANDQRFPDTFGAVKNFYLSPTMTFAINQQYIALEYLNAQKERVRGKKLKASIQ